MARVKSSPAFLTRLKKALIESLKASGIEAEVRSEPVPSTKLYRLAVFAPKFKKMYHSERQNLVWRITENALPPEERLRISMILTLTKDEAKEVNLRRSPARPPRRATRRAVPN